MEQKSVSNKMSQEIRNDAKLAMENTKLFYSQAFSRCSDFNNVIYEIMNFLGNVN